MSERHPVSSSRKTPVIPIKLSDVREMDEYEVEANKIKDVYLDKPAKGKPGNVAPVESLRERILRMSLFPSVFSAKQHHRTFGSIVTEDDDAENYMRKRTKKEREDGV